tara:strand:- start:446 stop:946 length:501 start_codon:yes stop_codon:yes gene_type:complete
MFNENQLKEIKVKLRKERYMYLGILSEYQTITQNLTQPINYTKLNQYQHSLFKRVLHGFKMYKKEELTTMHRDKKKRISKVWKRAQNVINCWKQEICNREANKIFAIFVNSKDAMKLAAMDPKDTDPTYINRMTLKDLRITYEDLIIKFIAEGLLPKNFLILKKAA